MDFFLSFLDRYVCESLEKGSVPYKHKSLRQIPQREKQGKAKFKLYPKSVSTAINVQHLKLSATNVSTTGSLPKVCILFALVNLCQKQIKNYVVTI